MRNRLYSAVLTAVLALALAPAAAMAGHPVAGQQRPHALQARHLEARPFARTWESRLLPPGKTVYARIYRRGVEIQQRWINNCAANYVGRGIVIRLRVTHCQPGHGRSAYRLRYKAATRMVFRVVLTTDAG